MQKFFRNASKQTSNVSKKTVRIVLKSLTFMFLVENSFFQAVFLDKKTDYFSGWKRAIVSDKVPPQPNSLRILFLKQMEPLLYQPTLRIEKTTQC